MISERLGARPARADAVLLVFGAVFGALAWTHGLRLDDDSYAHFAVSVRTLADGNWRSLITDTWNKPLTALVYGAAGLAGGLGLARTASVLLTLLAAVLLRRVLESWFGWTSREHVWFVPAFFLLQVGLLPQIFLTMTEQLAAVLLAAALYAWVRGRPWAAFLAAGFMPWARIESVFVVAALFLALSWEMLRTDWRRSLLRVTLLNALGALPFLSWWVAGFILSGRIAWMSASYAYLREPFWRNLGSVNAVTGLCGGLTAAHLLLAALGALAWRSAPRRSPSLPVLALPVAAHLLFASLVTVYPQGSGYEGWAIAALNTRSYATVAPLFCLLAGLGWQRVFGDGAASGAGLPPAHLRPAIALTALLCVGYAAFQGSFPLFSPVVRRGYLVLGLGTLAGAAALALHAGRIGRRRAAAAYAWLALAATAAAAPFFWYPMRWQDRRVAVQREFLRELANSPAQPPLVYQSLNGRLDFFAGTATVRMPWIYPAFMGQVAAEAPAGAWIVLETDERGTPVGYPEKTVRSLLESGDFARVRSFVDTAPRAAWQSALDRLTPRNRSGGWIILRRLPPRAR